MAQFTANFDFSNAPDYVLSSTKIVAGVLKLLDPVTGGLLFSESFTADTGFTYDNTKVEFTGGVARQKVVGLQTFVADFNQGASIDAAYGLGSTTGAGTGSPTASGGKLVLTGGISNKYVDYDGTLNANSATQTGTVNFGVVPNYSGVPSTYQIFFNFAQSAGSINNFIEVRHDKITGNLTVSIADSGGSTFLQSSLAPWSPVAGQLYEFELDYDITTGATRLFVDGVQQGPTLTNTGTRSSSVGLIRLGDEFTPQATTYADFSLSWFSVFDTVQHTGAYTPSGEPHVFLESKVDLPLFSYTGPGSIAALTSIATTESGSPRYTVEGKYFNGSAWVTSSGSYAQANPKATVLTNLASLSVLGETDISVSVVFPDSNVRASIDVLTLTYSANQYAASGTATTSLELNVNAFLAIAASGVVTPTGTNLKAAVYVDGVLKYWDGMAVVDSDGSLAQCNTFAEIDTNAPAFVGDVNSTLDFYLRLESTDPEVTPEIDAFTVEYDFGGVAVAPSICLVWGYYRMPNAVGQGGVKLKFQPVRPALGYLEAGNAVIGPSIEVETRSEGDVGYFETPLVRSSAYSDGPKNYRVKIIDGNGERIALKDDGTPLEFSVPDAVEKEITDLLAGA